MQRVWAFLLCMFVVSCAPAPPITLDRPLITAVPAQMGIPTEVGTALAALPGQALPPHKCRDAEVAAAQAALAPYQPSDIEDFVRVDGADLRVGDALYPVQGVNYYPSDAPWRRFLTEADPVKMAAELDLLQEAGFNTLRIFLWHGALFQCPGNGAVPVAASFARLDEVIQLAAARSLRVILVLNDLPDLAQYPLYASPEHSIAQMIFLADRYRGEAAIMAWDVRSEGDTDYSPSGSAGAQYTRHEVLSWLAETAALIRAYDPEHLITAGWGEDAAATIPYVDFVSMQHWDDTIRLRQRIAGIRVHTAKPIVLAAIGYSSHQMTPHQQGQRLQEALEAAQYDGLAGWLIWVSFDFPPGVMCLEAGCPLEEESARYFGLWAAGYEPKIALGLVRIIMYASPDER